jgi:hypothetical protein
MKLTPQDSRGRLVANRLQVLDASHPRAPHMGFEIGRDLRPGKYAGVIEITEADTSNFGAAGFHLLVP